MIYKRFSDLLDVYHRLESGDVFIGQIPSSHLKSAIMTDLAARGVTLLPSALAQLLHASKVVQAQILQPWMLPHTRAVTRRKQLMDAIDEYQQLGISVAVTKQDRLHCGHGVRKWGDLEMLYSCLAMDQTSYPFVLQPYREGFVDIRAICVGQFREAYTRDHPYNFRKNLAGGGQSHPYDLSQRQRQFCDTLLDRACMPYAHIDLMCFPDDEIYLSEMRLNGGIYGAKIERQTLERMKQKRLMDLIQ